MKIKQVLFATLFLGLTGVLAAQNNDNLRGRINDRPNQAVQRRPNAPQKTNQQMPDQLSDCQRDGLHGEVQNVFSVMYEADGRDNNTSRGSVMERLKTVYNQRGQRRSQSYLSNEEDMIFRTKYKHDDFGLVTLEHILDPEENVIGRTYYLYDADLILTEVYVEDEERQIESRVLYKYDAQGRISQRSFNDQANNVFRREIYIYGENDNIFKTVVFNAEGKKVQEVRYEYDEHNEPVSSTLYDYYEDPNMPELTITLYEYRYDEEGNWVTRYEYEFDNDKKIPTYIVERDIKYF
ncbi:MAG: hypothetical protein MJZ24_09085 [Paludibacteraceae bacterium]|nr:hypothetical protein [Paludibacteraceae bacterium]